MGGRLNLDGGTLTLYGGRVPPRPPYNLSTGCKQGCRILLSIGGDNLQFYLNFALVSKLGGMNLDHDLVQVSKLSED